MNNENRIITVAFGICFSLALGLAAHGQIGPAPSSPFSGGTISGVILGPSGSLSAPTYSFSASTGTGMYWGGGGNGPVFTNSGLLVAYFNAANSFIIQNGNLNFGGDGDVIALGSSADVILSHGAAAALQFGNIDAASPVAQRIQAQSVVAGNTNTAGATFTIAGSKSNGNGGGDVVLQTTLSNAASGTQNTLATALTLKGGTQQSNFSGVINPANSFTPTAGSGAASVVGNDQRFVVTAGTAQTSITANFGHTWTAAPVCTISSNSTASVVDIASTSTTAIVFGASVALTGSTINVLCFGS